MHVFFCTEQQQTLVTKKTLRSLDPFASVSNSYQSCKNFPSLIHAVNSQQLTLRRSGIPCYKLFSYTLVLLVASFPCTPCPAFCCLSVSKQKARWQPEKQATQSPLFKKSCIHMYTWSKRVSQQLQITYQSYKFSCKYALFMPSHLPHCTKHNVKPSIDKGLLTNSFKTLVLAIFQK